MSGSVLISIKLTARLAGVTDQAVRVAMGGCEASSSSLSDLAENERIDSL